MTNKSELNADQRVEVSKTGLAHRAIAVQRVLGWTGVVIATPFFLWAALGLLGPVPSMVDVFGVVGLRIPASITIGGLLLAAIGFHKF